MTDSPTIIPALYARQKERGGYLTDADMRSVARELGEPLYRIQSLVSFFPHFRAAPPPRVMVHVCRDMSCHLRGGVALAEKLRGTPPQHGGTVMEVHGVSCLGRCDRAPAVMINDQCFLGRTEAELHELVRCFAEGESPPADNEKEWAHRNARDWQMDVYQGKPAYDAVRNFVRDPNPENVLLALEKAGLLGMGGAGGRAYLKWGDVLRAHGSEKYIVCNADESEPGTFKDRDVLLTAPHLTIEGMILAGLVVGAHRGWIYIRHEYHEATEVIELALQSARQLGALGRNVFGSGRSFELEVFVSPGGYICGEQTALIEAMEDKRAEPRNRPPELMTNGYRNQPTLLSNVETFAWVPAIMLREGGEWYAEQGRKSGPLVADNGPQMRGRRLFSISGDVIRPGVYEVPTGIPLGELLDQYCGGMAEGKPIAAIALSGPSGGLLPPKISVQQLNREFVRKHVPEGVTEIDIRDVPLDINVARAMGLMIGAGLVVYGAPCDILAEALACSRFFRNESCGKCVPCRLGSEKITVLGEHWAGGNLSPTGLAELQELAPLLAQVMVATSICGLGQVASNPILSILRHFPELLERRQDGPGMGA